VSGSLRRLTGGGTGLLGVTGSAADTLKLLNVSISDYIPVTGSAAPILTLLQAAIAGDLSINTIASVLAMNLANGAVTEYQQFPFNSFAVFAVSVGAQGDLVRTDFAMPSGYSTLTFSGFFAVVENGLIAAYGTDGRTKLALGSAGITVTKDAYKKQLDPVVKNGETYTLRGWFSQGMRIIAHESEGPEKIDLEQKCPMKKVMIRSAFPDDSSGQGSHLRYNLGNRSSGLLDQALGRLDLKIVQTHGCLGFQHQRFKHVFSCLQEFVGEVIKLPIKTHLRAFELLAQRFFKSLTLVTNLLVLTAG